MTAHRYPRPLTPLRAPLPAELAERAVASLGPRATASRTLLEAGLVPPDLLAGMTLFLLTGQPRRERASQAGERGERASAVAGGVWVREQLTIHGPVRIGETLELRGEVAGQRVRAGRTYGTTTSQTRGETGELRVSSCTTGLLRYRPDPDLADGEEGRPEAEVPGPDAAAARANPALTALRELRVGDAFADAAVRVTLAMMRERDGRRSRNPIHTDPEEARRAGLRAPIAAGAHVLGFVQEMLMRAWGPQALLHGAHFDVRWLSPVEAGARVEPRAAVTERSDARAELALEVACEGRIAMAGRLVLPLIGAAGA
jgi:acyl dehydratase